MNTQQFIKHFSNFQGNFECILSNKNTAISKCLFQFQNPQPNKIQKFLCEHIRMPSNVEKIFTLYGKYISHVGIDTHTHRYKFYITLYHLSFQEGLRILTDCRKILGIASEYKLEKNFQKFDCIGFDIFQDGSTAMKIYELCDVPQIDFSVLPSSISYDNIKEVGFLKDFTGRKKMFFRCIFPIDISVFEDSFDFSSFDVFVKDIKDFYDVQKKVKYYCIEAENQEIYFM